MKKCNVYEILRFSTVPKTYHRPLFYIIQERAKLATKFYSEYNHASLMTYAQLTYRKFGREFSRGPK